MALNRTYIIRVLISGKLLTYTGKVIKDDDGFISFIDKYGKPISVNKSTIQSYEELK